MLYRFKLNRYIIPSAKLKHSYYVRNQNTRTTHTTATAAAATVRIVLRVRSIRVCARLFAPSFCICTAIRTGTTAEGG